MPVGHAISPSITNCAFCRNGKLVFVNLILNHHRFAQVFEKMQFVLANLPNHGVVDLEQQHQILAVFSFVVNVVEYGIDGAGSTTLAVKCSEFSLGTFVRDKIGKETSSASPAANGQIPSAGYG